MGLEKKRILRIGGDFTINILASLVYTFARQIVVFPLLAAHLGEDSYGTLLTVTGLCNVCTVMLGNTLLNVRMVQNSEYEKRGLSGDFNLLCLFGGGIGLICALVIGWMFHLGWLTTALLALYLPVAVANQYGIVLFRVSLNFKRVFCNYSCMSAAYVVSALLFSRETLWPATLLFGELAGLIHTVCTTSLIREPLARTSLFSETTKKLLVLMVSSLVGNLLMYADRMIIYPTLGAASVSYYSTASFFGKSASLVMTPAAGVLLSYFSQKNFKASKKLFALVNGLSLGCLGVFGVCCLLLAPWFTHLLYPTLYAGAEPYILLANLGAIVSIAGNMAQPMILKSCSTKWILAVQILYGGTYLAAALTLLPLYGLYGFCGATILANGVRLLALYALGFWKL